MATIDNIDLTSLLWQEGSAPSTPATTKWRLYFKTDGLYFKDDAGTETGPIGSGSLGAWTDYTPTWDAGGATSIGNGTLAGRYKALDSKTYAVHIYLSWGSTTTCTGTSTWNFTLPASKTSATGRQQVLAAHILDSGTDNKVGCATISAGSTVITQVVPEGGNTVTKTAPMTWATGDQLTISGIVEVQ